MGNKRVWFRPYGGGSWNNSGTANPATNVGGIDISAVFTAGVAAYPVCGMFQNGDGSIINLGQAAFIFAKPTNFVEWSSGNTSSVPSTPAGFTSQAIAGNTKVSDKVVSISSANSGVVTIPDTGMANWTNFLFELRSQ
jgi:hypothetical protein